jgi:hypothetical protein
MRLAAQAKGGFYPAHESAIDMAASLLRAPAGEPFSILDPCAEEGNAVRQLAERLGCPAASKYAIELVRSEKALGRQVWVFVQYTDKHDVQGRLERILGDNDLRVGVLRSSIPLARREDWINKNAQHLDVIISHPKLVETGLDLFDKASRHNFPTLCFY